MVECYRRTVVVVDREAAPHAAEKSRRKNSKLCNRRDFVSFRPLGRPLEAPPRIPAPPRSGPTAGAAAGSGPSVAGGRMGVDRPTLSEIPKKGKDPETSSSRARATPKSKKKAKAAAESASPAASRLPTMEETPEGAVSLPLLQLACGTVMEVVSAKPCQLRAEFELTSDKAGEVAGGTVVYVLEQRQTADGATRMSIVPEGQTASIGWLTGITKDGKKNLSELGRPVLEVIAAKPLAARAAFELTSDKAGEVACKALIHVLDARETADGAIRVAYCAEGASAVKGWVTAVTKDGTINLALVKDFKAHKASGGSATADASAAPTGGAGSPNAQASSKSSSKKESKAESAGKAPATSSDVPNDAPAAAVILVSC